MRTYVYVDAFNLYFGALKNTPYRWLDISKFCQRLLPKNQIYWINYYTALVTARPNDPQQPIRQQLYLRALRTLPHLTIHLGHFLSHRVSMPVVSPPPNFIEVIKTEEKGSDVNLATHLLADGFQDRYDVAVVVSNDSDLVEPIKVVHHVLHKIVGVVNPQTQNHPSKELMAAANFFRQLRPSILGACQFPTPISDAAGTFHKPASW